MRETHRLSHPDFVFTLSFSLIILCHPTIRAFSALTRRRISSDGARITGRTARKRRYGNGAVVACAQTGARGCISIYLVSPRAASFNELKKSAHKYLFVFPDFFSRFFFPFFMLRPTHFSRRVFCHLLSYSFHPHLHIASTHFRPIRVAHSHAAPTHILSIFLNYVNPFSPDTAFAARVARVHRLSSRALCERVRRIAPLRYALGFLMDGGNNIHQKTRIFRIIIIHFHFHQVNLKFYFSRAC